MGNNTDVFAAGFDASDRRIFAMMRVLGEVAAGGARHLTYDQRAGYVGLGPMVTGIDWTQYFTEYEVTMALIKLVQVHGPAATISEEKEEQDDSVLVFGGDSP